MHGADLSLYLQIFSVLGSALLAIKLFKIGLWRRYRVFFWFTLVNIADSLWPFLFSNTSSQRYLHVWLLSQPIQWIFHILVVVELYRLILENHPGIYSLGKWAMYGAVIIAVCISILCLLPRFSPRMPQQSKYIPLELATNRGIDFALVIFLILILIFLSRFPIKLSRNVVVHAAVYTLYFLSNSLAVFLRTLFGIKESVLTSQLFMGGSCACFVAWLILLSRRGEEVKPMPTISSKREQNAMRQLEALNATLLRVR